MLKIMIIACSIDILQAMFLFKQRIYPWWEQGYIVGDNFLVWREAYVFYSSGLYLKNYYSFAKDNVFNT